MGEDLHSPIVPLCYNHSIYTSRIISQFQKKIWDFYVLNKRDFPWRETRNPYKILVSEVMLQQTQTSRVLPKYEFFLEKFPTITSLAKAKNEDVLRLWSGLGYNRRALYLKRTAEIISSTKDVWVTPEFLQTLPGIGPNTAGAIYVFSTNKPHVFIETNIRRVFIYEFFKDKSEILDKDILKLINSTLDIKKPRDWYYALMDYGAYLAKTETNPNRKSKHYTKQSKFEGSLRQIRGKILKLLLEKGKMPEKELEMYFKDKEKLTKALQHLEKDRIIINTDSKISIA